jgi:hypothetical protein
LDKVTQPGISITAACFGNRVYADVAAKKCFSNLLAVGYRRFVLDAYWDPSSRVWSLCPSQLGQTPQTTSNSTATPTGSKVKRGLVPRQTTVGQYTCSSTLTLDSFGQVLVEYLKATNTNLEARMTYLSINVHTASPLSGSTSRLNSSQVPNQDQEICDIMKDLSGDLYTPVRLRSERENLNGTWLAVPKTTSPELSYLNTTLDSKNELTTQNGWPDIGDITFEKRLIIALGSVDDSMRNYNMTNDFLSYHNTSSITNFASVTFDSSGKVSQGCLFDADNRNLALTTQWSMNSNINLPSSDQRTASTIASVSNLTACGISPFINSTLSTSADVAVTPHLSLILSTIWSWAPSEPRNITSADPFPDRLRCALQDISLDGHWRIADCTETRHAACRSIVNPLNWSFSSSRGSYQTRENACPAGTSFAAPRTALENRYLAAAFSQFRSAQPSNSGSASDPGPWIDFNSLNQKTCWVQGASTICPYQNGATTTSKRQVVVPIVAAVIVLVIAALLLFVKCAANRRNMRRGRKRRGKEEGGEYEGVPS